MNIRYDKLSISAQKLLDKLDKKAEEIASAQLVRPPSRRRSGSPTAQEFSFNYRPRGISDSISVTRERTGHSQTDVLPSSKLLPWPSTTGEIVRCKLTFRRKADTWEVSADGDEQALQLLLQYCRDRVGRKRRGNTANQLHRGKQSAAEQAASDRCCDPQY